MNPHTLVLECSKTSKTQLALLCGPGVDTARVFGHQKVRPRQLRCSIGGQNVGQTGLRIGKKGVAVDEEDPVRTFRQKCLQLKTGLKRVERLEMTGTGRNKSEQAKPAEHLVNDQHLAVVSLSIWKWQLRVKHIFVAMPFLAPGPALMLDAPLSPPNDAKHPHKPGGSVRRGAAVDTPLRCATLDQDLKGKSRSREHNKKNKLLEVLLSLSLCML